MVYYIQTTKPTEGEPIMNDNQIREFLLKAENQAAVKITGVEINDLIPIIRDNIERKGVPTDAADQEKAMQKLLFDILVDTLVDFYAEPHLTLTDAQAKIAYKWAKDEALDIFTNHAVSAEDHIARIKENGKNLFRDTNA